MRRIKRSPSFKFERRLSGLMLHTPSEESCRMLLVAQARPREIRHILSTRKLSQKHAIWKAARPRTSVSTALHTTREIVCRFVAFFSVTVALLTWTHGVFYGSVKHRVCVRVCAHARVCYCPQEGRL